MTDTVDALVHGLVLGLALFTMWQVVAIRLAQREQARHIELLLKGGTELNRSLANLLAYLNARDKADGR